jgi:hypothetical protein
MKVTCPICGEIVESRGYRKHIEWKHKTKEENVAPPVVATQQQPIQPAQQQPVVSQRMNFQSLKEVLEIQMMAEMIKNMRQPVPQNNTVREVLGTIKDLKDIFPQTKIQDIITLQKEFKKLQDEFIGVPESEDDFEKMLLKAIAPGVMKKFQEMNTQKAKQTTVPSVSSGFAVGGNTYGEGSNSIPKTEKTTTKRTNKRMEKRRKKKTSKKKELKK